MGFYQLAGNALASVIQGKTSLVGATIGNIKVPQKVKKRMYAALCQTIQKAKMLLYIIDNSLIISGQHKIKDTDLLVILNDLFFARGGIAHDSEDPVLKKLVFYHKNKLFKLMKATKTDPALAPKAQIKFNTLKMSVKDVISLFETQGYKFIDTVKYSEFQSKLQHKSKKFGLDTDLTDLLVFPSGTDLILHELYLNGSIILQDKASCFPAFILNPEPGSTVIDACAAPGNKTSHLASIMNNKGKIFAYDLDNNRLDTLIKQTNLAGCNCIEARCSSFLDIDPNSAESAKIDYILLDPSCSGSGIVSRSNDLVDSLISTYIQDRKFDYQIEVQTQIKPNSATRIKNLSNFQTRMLLHAMKFPNVKKITYSTCSVYHQENENVVENVLSSQTDFKLANQKLVLQEWPKRGEQFKSSDNLTPTETSPSVAKSVLNNLNKDEQCSLVRSSTEEMYTNGFFVACFFNKNHFNKTEYIDNPRRKITKFVEEQVEDISDSTNIADKEISSIESIKAEHNTVKVESPKENNVNKGSKQKSKTQLQTKQHPKVESSTKDTKQKIKTLPPKTHAKKSTVNTVAHSGKKDATQNSSLKRKNDQSNAAKNKSKKRIRTPITLK
ncbi:hypothetical protein BB561_005913 [Smittium simulii]|uniref:SAM-dependent MTase RsmB/NOP-type domain-containing protein n=1 Tax=Smittium simulii TaxID=133385 RepID=A0A2T9Y7K8_9FUNG|nr:hypothetical protein BB561_005913 [Smittium simulii]